MEEVKKGKKKNKVASLLLALALILTCGVAGTIAQYQKSVDGSSTANVASFKVGATDSNGTATFNIFDTVTDSDGSTENEVATGKIAPGTTGTYKVTLTNDSDVKVNYALKVELVNGTGVYTDAGNATLNGKKIPLEFALSSATSVSAVQSSEWVSIDNLSSSSAGLQGTTGTLAIGSTTQTKEAKNLYWRWAFTDGQDPNRDALDTAIGESIAANDGKFVSPQAKVSVVFTQVD